MIRLSHRRQRQLRSELGRRVAQVERRIHLDEIERRQPAGFGRHLHDDVRFAVVEAAFDGGADAGGNRRIADVQSNDT